MDHGPRARGVSGVAVVPGEPLARRVGKGALGAVPTRFVGGAHASLCAPYVLFVARLAALAAFPALAQTKFPTRPIRIVQPFAAGSVSDVSLRLWGDKLAARIGAQIVIDNQPRAGGITAATAVLSAPPDGYT